jgi:ribosomal protein S18 acetylase RimI-like enzyme
MNTTISIRLAEPEDIPTIGFLAQQVWPRAYGDILSEEQLRYMLHLFYSPDSLRRQMQEDNHVFLVVEEDEEAIGFASYSETAEPGIYKLHKLYILPGQQGKGLGNTLLGFILGEIGPLGARAIRLNVNRHNKARQFYEKLGFSVIGQEDNAIGNNYFMNDYVMEKLL